MPRKGSRRISTDDVERLLASTPGAKALGVNLEGLVPGHAAPGPKPPKYHNTRTLYRGRWFDSQNEAVRARELDLLRGVEVSDWFPQVTLLLDPAWGEGCFVYRPDFLVLGLAGTAWFEDVKGAETDRFGMVRRRWRTYLAADLHVLKRRRNGWDREIVEGHRHGGSAAHR